MKCPTCGTEKKTTAAKTELKIAQFYAMAQLFQVPVVQELIGKMFKDMEKKKT